MSKGFRRNAPRTLRFFVRTCVSSRQPLVPFRGMRPGSSCGSSTPRFRSFSRTHRSIRSPFFGSTSDGTIHGPTSPPLHPSSLPSRGCRTPEARPRHHHPRRPCHVHSRFGGGGGPEGGPQHPPDPGRKTAQRPAVHAVSLRPSLSPMDRGGASGPTCDPHPEVWGRRWGVQLLF
eukprot:scaffold172_cov341-Pavlova_lutheri.AAC.30